MKRRVINQAFLLTALVATPLVTVAQETETDYVSDNDGGRTTGAVWTEVGVTKILPYNLSIGLDAGFRTDDWFNEPSRFDIGLGLSWKPGKHWKFGIGYTFVNKYYISETERKSVSEIEYKYKNLSPDPTTFLGAPKYTDDDGTKYSFEGYNDAQKDYVRMTDSYWRPKHRLSIDASYTNKFWKILRVTLRERYQLTLIPSKNVTRTRYRTKTVTKYRDPKYPGGLPLSDYETYTSYESYTNYWQEGNTIYSQEYLDDDDDNTYEEQAKQDVTTAYLADHENEGLNTITEQEKTKSDKTLHVLRSRLTFEIDKKGWLWTPYIYIESFNNMGDSWHFDKLRLSAGVEYSLGKQHKVNIGYVFNHENDDDGDENIHAVCVGYKFKF